MAFLGSLLVEIKGDNSKLDKSIKGSEATTKKFSKASVLAYAAVAAAVVALGKKAVRAFAVQEQAEAKLNATIKATGSAANLTAKELTDMASALQQVTKFGDEEIIGAETLLLTFKSIGEDVFPQALESILDVSEAMGQGLKESTIQLGKALNDPITGMTALRRVGIQFSESQENTIKSMVEMNDLAGAQNVILEEMQSQFGGVARAAADTATGSFKQMGNSLGDLEEQMGQSIAEGLQPMAEATKNLTDELVIWLKKNRDIQDMFTDIFEGADQSTKSMEELEAVIAAGAKSAELMSKGFGDGFDQKLIDARNEAIILLGHLQKTQDLEQRYAKEIAQNRTDAAAATKLEIETGDAKIASIERLEELRIAGLSTQEQELENIQTEINGLWRFRETTEVMSVINELVKRRTELNEELNETLNDENDTIIKVSDSTALAHAEGMIGIGRQAKAVEELTMDYETLARDGLGSFVDAFAMVGEAGVTGWEIVGQAGKDAISTVLDAYAKLWSIQAIAEFAKPFGVGIPSGLGYLSAAIAAKAGSGFVQNLAEGGVLQPSSGGTPAIMAEAGVPEMALPLNSTAIVPFARAIAGEIGNNTTNNNTQNFNSTFSLSDDNQLREAARKLFPFMQDEEIRRGITV